MGTRGDPNDADSNGMEAVQEIANALSTPHDQGANQPDETSPKSRRQRELDNQ